MEDWVLELLTEAEGYLSGQQIGQALGVSRAAVWKAVERLRARGYVIDSVTRQGYSLRSAPQNMDRDAIWTWLPQDHPWRDRIAVLAEADSTNTRLKVLAAGNAPEGTVLIAERQTGGRGRMGRSFVSPPGMGVYLSVLLRPECPAGELMHLTCAVGVAMCDAIQDVTGFRPGIKWTNDLVGEDRKLAGILTELSVEAESGAARYAVAGIGVNCHQRPEDFPPELRDRACSLEMLLAHPVDRNRLAAAMILRLYKMRAALLSGRNNLLSRYRQDCVTLGREVVFQWAGKEETGVARDVDPEGALIVELSGGKTVQVSSGEVSIRGKTGYL